ncbi:hypothetical protein [Cloacibacillus evryensis]|uniref:hypothetical protein n=1 Tax=Cloacibacillus evryensis TaxID=508460 RepID=UPI00370D0CAF
MKEKSKFCEISMTKTAVLSGALLASILQHISVKRNQLAWKRYMYNERRVTNVETPLIKIIKKHQKTSKRYPFLPLQSCPLRLPLTRR